MLARAMAKLVPRDFTGAVVPSPEAVQAESSPIPPGLRPEDALVEFAVITCVCQKLPAKLLWRTNIFHDQQFKTRSAIRDPIRLVQGASFSLK